MDEKKFNEWVEALNEYTGVEEVFLLNGEGEIKFKNKDFPFSNEEGKAFLKAWIQKEPALIFQNVRYTVLKNDEIQLAAKNIAKGMGNIAGSITKEGNYLIAHIAQETDMILLEWSIFVNKIGWS